MDLSGRTILVTGASSGIGRETAILLSQLGAKVAISGRDSVRLQQTLERLEGDGHREFVFDLSESEQIIEWMKSVVSQTGPLYGLVHSAGMHAALSVRAISMQLIDSVTRANIASALLLVRALCQKGCYERGASVVLLSSVVAVVGAPTLSLYGASKGAVLGMTKSLAAELARQQVRVNCVAPGLVRTEMTKRWEESLMPEQFEAIERNHPLGLGQPLDIAYAIAFLLAETGRWITGSTLFVDGGYTAI